MCQTKTARIVPVAFIVALVHIFHVAAVATVAAAVAARLPAPPSSRRLYHHNSTVTIKTILPLLPTEMITFPSTVRTLATKIMLKMIAIL